MLSALPQRDEQIAGSDAGEQLLRTVPGNVVQSIRAARRRVQFGEWLRNRPDVIDREDD